MKKRILLIVILFGIWLIAAGVSFLQFYDTDYTGFNYNPEYRHAYIDYLSIQNSGGLSGHADDLLEVYKEGDKFYLVSTRDGSEKHELTKTEYLLCTAFVFEFLEDDPGVNGSDLIYQTITFRQEGGEEVTLPKKSYSHIPGMIKFFERIKTTPDYEMTMADEMAIRIGEYCDYNNHPDIQFISCKLTGGGHFDYYLEQFYGQGTGLDKNDFMIECKNDIENNASRIASVSPDGMMTDKFKEAFKPYKKIQVGSQTMYYRVQSTENVLLISLVDLENNTYYCTYSDFKFGKPDSKRYHDSDNEYRRDGDRQTRIYDILGIMTGKDLTRNKLWIALTVETAVCAAAVVVVLVRTRKKKDVSNVQET